MVHPGHPDWVTPALSPSSENRVKMSEIQRSKTKMVIDTDPLPNEEWPRKLDFKTHPGKGCPRRLMKTCRIMRGRKRMGRGALSVLPTAELGVHKGSYQAPDSARSKDVVLHRQLSWRTYQSVLWVLEIFVLKRRKSRFRCEGSTKYVETPSILNRRSSIMYACTILCSFWPLLWPPFEKLLGLNGSLLWSAVATFVLSSYSQK